MESWIVPLFIVVILVVVVQLVRLSLKTRRTMAQAQELLAEAPTTRGVVVDTYTRRQAGLTSRVTYYMVVRFTTHDGRTVEFHARRGSSAVVGREVEVRYDPENPEGTYAWEMLESMAEPSPALEPPSESLGPSPMPNAPNIQPSPTDQLETGWGTGTKVLLGCLAVPLVILVLFSMLLIYYFLLEIIS